MGWYGLEAFESAIKRTKKALIEPFVFWKWIRLGIITIFIGGAGMGIPNFNFPASWQTEYRKTEFPPTTEIIDKITQFWHQYQTYILIALAFIIFMILLFTLLSSVMEFVFVESLVTNSVTIRAYFRKYLYQGFNLFIVKIILGIIFLSLFLLAMLPVFRQLLSGDITPGLILSSIVWFFGIALILAVLSGITGSFISLAIPVVMYQEVGIITAIKQILGRFKEDWRQIAVYWVVRFFAWAAGAIVVGLAAVILFIIIFLILLIPALILYFILSALGGSFLFWALMIPYGLIALVVLIIFLLIISVPLPVFMKYHLLTFMEIWYLDVRIPLDYPDNFPISTEEQRKKTPDKNINELDKQKKIPFSLTRREAIATMLIVLLIIMVYTGFLLLRGWSLPPDAQVKVNYNYTVNVGEVIGLTLAGIGVAFAGVAYAYKMWAEGKG